MSFARFEHLRRRTDRVLIYGHRGARGVFPENTLQGFDYLSQIGIDAVEIDVLTARDGVPVVTHNPYLLPETTRDADGNWLTEPSSRVCDMDTAELASFDIGAIRPGTRYHTRFSDQARLNGVSVPSLDAFCEWAKVSPNFILDIEIKSFASEPHLTLPPKELATAVLQTVQRHGLMDRAIWQSFDWRVLHAMREIEPDVPLGYLSQILQPERDSDGNIYEGSPWTDGIVPENYDAGLPDAIIADGGDFWCPHYKDLTATSMARAKSLNLPVNVWTVNDPSDIAHMALMGVDGIITDFPARAQNVLTNLDIGWRLA
ncbi:glycerophosphodiester phosphodiesterase (plasmid) [Rhodobacteraceae bacterium SC52]|nr:glycerophosphodiester phosphodiesterase [Rhodobacteraceae bacterium SC52]